MIENWSINYRTYSEISEKMLQSKMLKTGKIDENYDYMVKLIIIGDSGVGKTNILTRFCNDQFKETHLATIGVDFNIKNIQIDNKRLKLQIWDTAGQERFKTITETYYRGAAGIILCYAVNSEESFQSICMTIVIQKNGQLKSTARSLPLLRKFQWLVKQMYRKDQCLASRESKWLKNSICSISRGQQRKTKEQTMYFIA